MAEFDFPLETNTRKRLLKLVRERVGSDFTPVRPPVPEPPTDFGLDLVDGLPSQFFGDVPAGFPEPVVEPDLSGFIQPELAPRPAPTKGEPTTGQKFFAGPFPDVEFGGFPGIADEPSLVEQHGLFKDIPPGGFGAPVPRVRTPSRSREFEGPSLIEQHNLFKDIPEGGFKTLPPVAGILPAGTSFADMIQVYSLPLDIVGELLFESMTFQGVPERAGDPGLLNQMIIGPAKEFQERSGAEQIALSVMDPTLLVAKVPSLITRSIPTLANLTPALAKGLAGSDLGPDHAGMLRLLMREYGVEDVAATNEFAGPLLNLHEVIDEVVVNDELVGRVAALLGVNPSVIKGSPAGRGLTAYQRQIIAGEELTTIVLGAVIDSKMQRVTGRMGRVLPIDKDGFFGDTGKMWQDVFGKPDDFNLSAETRALIDDYNQVINVEIERILSDAGIDRHIRARPSNEYYVPHDVEEIRGIETRRHSDSQLQRHYDEATEGVEQGIKYNVSPRETLEFHLRWAYRKAAKKQLDDYLEPLSITPKDIVPQFTKDIYAANMVTKRGIEQLRRKIRKGIAVAEANLRTSKVRLGERGRVLDIVESDIVFLDELIQSLDVLPRELETIRPAVIRPGRTVAVIKKDLDAAEDLLTSVKESGGTPAAIQENLDIVDNFVRELEQEAARPTIRRKTRVGITPEPARRGRIRNISKAKQARDEYRRLLKKEKGGKSRFQTAERLDAKIQDRLSVLREHLAAVDLQLPEIRHGYTVSKNNYKNALALAKKENQVPGALFGANQPDEIPIGLWKEGFKGERFLPRDEADLVTAALGQQRAKGATFMKGVEILGNTIRTLAATGDFAQPLIQGLPVLAENPVAWARMLLRHHQAFFDPGVSARLMRDNIADYQWLAQHQVPIGDPEFFAALNPGEGVSLGALLEKLPQGQEVRRVAGLAGKQTFGRFQASYNTGLGYSRVLLYQGLKDTWKGTDASLAQYIRNLTGGLDSRALGVGPDQRAVEGIWMAFSPRLLRSTVALFKDAMNPTTQVGRRSLQNLTRLASGAMLTYTLTGMALGKDWDEIRAGLNPLNGKRFLAHEVNGDWIGVGGQVRAITQLLWGVSAGLILEPESLIKWDRFENPILQFLGGRGAPGQNIVGALIEGLTQGKVNALPYDEVDNPIDIIKHIGTSMTFFAVQGKLEGENNVTVSAALLGARTSAETQGEKVDAARKTVMKRENIPGDYEKLDRSLRGDVDADKLVVAAKEEASKDPKTDVGLYIQATEKINADIDLLIKESADSLGPSKGFRKVLPEHQTERAIRMKAMKAEDRYQDAQKWLDEQEPRETQIDIATVDYFEKLEAAELENKVTGEFDFDARDAIMAELRRDPPDGHGDAIIDEVERLNRKDEHPLITKLREDRETVKDYWGVNEAMKTPDVMPEFFYRIWDQYISENDPTRKKFLKAQNPDFIKGVEDQRDSIRAVMRLMNPDIERVLIEWGYGFTNFETEEGLRSALEKTQDLREPANAR